MWGGGGGGKKVTGSIRIFFFCRPEKPLGQVPWNSDWFAGENESCDSLFTGLATWTRLWQRSLCMIDRSIRRGLPISILLLRMPRMRGNRGTLSQEMRRVTTV